MKKLCSLSILLLASALTSCTFLDVVPKGRAQIADFYRTHIQTDKYVCSLYSHTYHPDKWDIGASIDLCGGGDMISGPGGETRYYNWKSLLFDHQETSSSTYTSIWSQGGTHPTGYHSYKIWEGIRNAYSLLAHIEDVPDASEAERNLWKGEAYWIIAYYHQIMLEYYGPIVIVDHEIGLDEDMNVSRSPFLDCVQFISDTFDLAAEYLPATQPNPFYGRATKASAKALKARLWLYAASPLVNGNQWYSDLKNKDGIPLIPQTPNKELWKKAMEMAEQGILQAEKDGYGLYAVSKATDRFSRGYEDYRGSFIGSSGTEFYNHTEHLFADKSDGYHTTCMAPRVGFNSYTTEGLRGYVVPTFDAVRIFFSKNGLPMDKDPETKSLDLYSVGAGDSTVLLHRNREPRFYACIGYDRGEYDINGTTIILRCRRGEEQQNDGDPRNEYQSCTGYYIKKWISKADGYDVRTKKFSVNTHDVPLIRVAELYLDYAEAEAEYTGTLSPKGLAYLNKVRSRAGIPDFEDAWKSVGGIPSGTELVNVIRQERMIEFIFEGRWYHDIRRWKVAGEYLAKTPESWTLSGKTATEFYRRKTIDESPMKRSFETPKNYWKAIPQDQINISSEMVQNPGY